MKRTWTIIGVADVPGSFKWYQSLFGQPKTPPPITTLGISATRMERSCSAFTSGAPMSIRRCGVRTRAARQRASPVFPCRRFRCGDFA